jgi:signal transduction histidine kinase
LKLRIKHSKTIKSEYLETKISETGEGIPEKYLNKLYDPFSQPKIRTKV